MLPGSSSSSRESFLLAPSAKRQKVELEENKRKPQPQAASSQDAPKSEFPLRGLEEFYKTCPTYRLPVEIGCFSLDDRGKQKLDNSQLRYFASPTNSSRLNFDLRVGYDKYVPVDKGVPSNKLNPILRWLAVNGECFRPKVFSPRSPNEGVVNGVAMDDSRRVSVGETVSPTMTAKERYVCVCIWGEREDEAIIAL